MKIVADRDILAVESLFSQLGDLRCVEGRSICRNDLLDADVLIVRSITPITSGLLIGTETRFVGTATVGIDHVDVDYLRQQGITLASAAGTASTAAAEHVLATLLELHCSGRIDVREERIAIVGVGAVGARIATYLTSLGISPFLFDPPRELRDPPFTSASPGNLHESEVLILALPMTSSGRFATKGLVDAAFLSRFKAPPYIINVGRGATFPDETVMNTAPELLRGASLDVWETEPIAGTEMMDATDLFTPHVAGYSRDSKYAASFAVASALARFLGTDLTAERELACQPQIVGVEPGSDDLQSLHQAIRQIYDVRSVSEKWRGGLAAGENPRELFDLIRRELRGRRGFRCYGVAGALTASIRQALIEVGFSQLPAPPTTPTPPLRE